MNASKTIGLLLILAFFGCSSNNNSMSRSKSINAKEILGNENYPAICYGGYRKNSRNFQPTVNEIKEDLRILSAMGIRMIRTYNVQLPQASNVLLAIRELKEELPSFEMYVMLGVWIDCKNAWTENTPDHNAENPNNESEVLRAIALAQQYPEIVKIMAIGNEAMVHWATSYYVTPSIILKWVQYVQNQKSKGLLSKDLWVTSSDNFASWGAMPEYRKPALDSLIQAVDYVSMHTYPMHDTHYNPTFWNLEGSQNQLDSLQKIDVLMQKSLEYAQSQYQMVENYVHKIAPDKPIHIGETGWASQSDGFYGPQGSRACDEYKQGLYYKKMRDWTAANHISCFFFEAFDENWKDAQNPNGSENHFGLFTLDGQAKYALWNEVDRGVFKGLKRGGNSINKTYKGDLKKLMKTVEIPSQSNKTELQP